MAYVFFSSQLLGAGRKGLNIEYNAESLISEVTSNNQNSDNDLPVDDKENQFTDGYMSQTHEAIQVGVRRGTCIRTKKK